MKFKSSSSTYLLKSTQNVYYEKFTTSKSIELGSESFAVLTISTKYVSISINERTFLLPENSIVLLTSDDIIHIKNTSDAILQLLIFKPTFVNSLLTIEFLRHYTPAIQPESLRSDSSLLLDFIKLNFVNRIYYTPELIFSKTKTLLDQFEKSASDDFFVRHNLIQLLFILIRVRTTAPLTLLLIPDHISSIHTSLEYIHKNLFTDISLQSIAYATSSNRTTLNYLFKRELGISIINYIVKLRICIAARYLRTTQHSVCEIAEMVGIYDYSQFARNFKKVLLLPPLEYKKCYLH